MSDSVRITSNFKEKSKQIDKYAKRLKKTILRDAVAASMQEIANVSAQDFFNPTFSLEEARTAPPLSDMITSRSNRLISSILGSFNFNSTGLPPKTKSLLSTPPKAGKGKSESIREIKVTPFGFSGIMGSKVPYAAIHEFGGDTGRATIPARPYLHPAIEKSQEHVFDIFRSALINSFELENI